MTPTSLGAGAWIVLTRVPLGDLSDGWRSEMDMNQVPSPPQASGLSLSGESMASTAHPPTWSSMPAVPPRSTQSAAGVGVNP